MTVTLRPMIEPLIFPTQPCLEAVVVLSDVVQGIGQGSFF